MPGTFLEKVVQNAVDALTNCNQNSSGIGLASIRHAKRVVRLAIELESAPLVGSGLVKEEAGKFGFDVFVEIGSINNVSDLEESVTDVLMILGRQGPEEVARIAQIGRCGQNGTRRGVSGRQITAL
ncbi:unnamed protein product, partial [marine sediment metagenome]